MPAKETFDAGAEHAESGGRGSGDDLRRLVELLREAAQLSDGEDHDRRLEVMQAVHDHPAANDSERAEAAHPVTGASGSSFTSSGPAGRCRAVTRRR